MKSSMVISLVCKCPDISDRTMGIIVSQACLLALFLNRSSFVPPHAQLLYEPTHRKSDCQAGAIAIDCSLMKFWPKKHREEYKNCIIFLAANCAQICGFQKKEHGIETVGLRLMKMRQALREEAFKIFDLCGGEGEREEGSMQFHLHGWLKKSR